MQQEELQQLVRKYFSGTAVEEERTALFDWYRSLTTSEVEWLAEYPDEEERLRAAMLKNILYVAGLDKPARVHRLWPRFAAAASILVILSAGGYWLYDKLTTHHSPLTTHHYTNDIKPGHDQATLTLADGRKIILRKGLNGTLAKQGSSDIIADNTAIAYTTTKAPSPMEREGGEVNTLTTARGEQSPYPLVLADGTKVWLNAESKLTFPAEFNGSDRTVKLSGEAYFEVVHNARKPFRVIAGNQTIEDLGTAFDINAYTDDPVSKTTVLTGAVALTPSQTKNNSASLLHLEKVDAKVRTDEAERAGVRLNPGQQAVVPASSPSGRTGGGITIRTVDPQTAIAWKNGLFRLDEQSLGEIMRQVSRWYDVDVIFEDNALRAEAFGGVTTRSANVSVLLHQLELTNQVRFKINGRILTIQRYNRP